MYATVPMASYSPYSTSIPFPPLIAVLEFKLERLIKLHKIKESTLKQIPLKLYLNF